jgi:hypothetical protein
MDAVPPLAVTTVPVCKSNVLLAAKGLFKFKYKYFKYR